MVYRFVNTILRVYFDKQMHVIRHDFHFDYIGIDIGTDCLYQLLQSCVYTINENLTPIFGSPDHMILTGIEHITIAFISHISIIPSDKSNKRGTNNVAPYIPTHKCGGVTAFLVKNNNGIKKSFYLS